MDRRNFIENLLAFGAGFTVLPPSTTYLRIWRAERSLVLPESEFGSIWKFYYMSLNFSEKRIPSHGNCGSLLKKGNQFWYHDGFGWTLLRKMTRPLTWPTGLIYEPGCRDAHPLEGAFHCV